MSLRSGKGLVIIYLAFLSLLISVVTIYLSLAVDKNITNPANTIPFKTSILFATITALILSNSLTIMFLFLQFRPLIKIRRAVQDLSRREIAYRSSEPRQFQILSETNLASYILHLQKEAQGSQTERKHFQEALENLSDGIIIAAADGSIQFMNSAARKLFSVQEELISGNSLVKVCRHHAIIDLWRETYLTGESHQSSIELARQQVFLQVFGIPLIDSRTGNTLLVFKDITQQRHLEAVRRDFISNISHELRTPLASLKALSETLQESLVSDPQTARRFLDNIEVEIDSLTLLVQELLELARIESGKIPLQMKLIPPESVIASAIERLRLQAERKDLSILVDLPADIPEILADPIRLEQVMVNLIHNAIKFTPSGGKIMLSVESDTTAITFVVRDNGVGISSKDLPRIFERFYKGDRSRSSEGTGLGLAIARHLVEAHGGKIWAESEEGKGSSFYFSIPLSRS